eukprot:4964931-Prymnesium_polylepis.2
MRRRRRCQRSRRSTARRTSPTDRRGGMGGPSRSLARSAAVTPKTTPTTTPKTSSVKSLAAGRTCAATCRRQASGRPCWAGTRRVRRLSPDRPTAPKMARTVTKSAACARTA